MTSKLEERKIKNLSFNRYQPPKRKIRMSINPQTEMENIFDDLKEKSLFIKSLTKTGQSLIEFY